MILINLDLKREAILRRSKKIKSVAAAVVPTLTDTLPEVDKALPGIVEVVQDFTPFVKGIESLLRRKK